MSPKRGDFASDLTTLKLRPVLVVQADELNTGLPQLSVAMVSSNMDRAGQPSRVAIRMGNPIWRRRD